MHNPLEIVEDKQFIAGFLIADGCLHWRKIKRDNKYIARIQFDQKEREILDIIRKILKKYDIMKSDREVYHRKDVDAYRLCLDRNEDVLNFCKWLPNLRMTRKEQIRLDIIESNGVKNLARI